MIDELHAIGHEQMYKKCIGQQERIRELEAERDEYVERVRELEQTLWNKNEVTQITDEGYPGIAHDMLKAEQCIRELEAGYTACNNNYNKARHEVRKLKQIIADAPHSEDCATYDYDCALNEGTEVIYDGQVIECNCWKSRVNNE